MRIKILGAGWYGCHLAEALIDAGHYVTIFESRDDLFRGASGNNPARLHLGFHYPRSRITRALCQEHHQAFMDKYGGITHGVPVNIYAIAEDDSFLDFGTYKQVLQNELEFIEIHDPGEFGLKNVEGALLTGERHILVDWARSYFKEHLDTKIVYGVGRPQDFPDYDLVLDCTFCSNDCAGVDRYEPCLVVLLKGPVERAVTIMDGPFPSLYPWNENLGLSSLSSAKYTPFSKSMKEWGEAVEFLKTIKKKELIQRGHEMLLSMAKFYPSIIQQYTVQDYRLSIRAMPKSAADTRFVEVVKVDDKLYRVRAGKIDAVFHAEKLILDLVRQL